MRNVVGAEELDTAVVMYNLELADFVSLVVADGAVFLPLEGSVPVLLRDDHDTTLANGN